MKKQLITIFFIVVSSALFFAGCGDDPDVPNDGENVYNDSDGSGDENHASDNDPNGQDPNENQDGETTDSDDAQGDAECGNGVREGGETCDTETVECSELDSRYTGGTATCRAECNGWLTDNCEAKSNVQSIGKVEAVTQTLDYLYNGQSALDEAANMDNELYPIALFEGSVPLNNGETYYIPNNQANTHWIAAAYDSASLQVFQNSFYCDASYNNCQITEPFVTFGIDIKEAKAGKRLNIGVKDGNQANFLVQSFTPDSEDCVLLVGYGTVEINSVSIAPAASGSIKFTTSDIDLYLVANTPEGDMSSEIEGAGFKVCTE